jgi:ATP-binding cassette subfamily B multidrug efflux pump
MAPHGTLSRLMRRYRRQYGIGTAALVLVNLCDVALPLVLKFAIDDIVVLRGLVPLSAIALAYFGAVVIQGVYRYFWRRYFIGASHRIANELRDRLHAHLTRLSFGYFNAQRTGDLMSRATNDLEAVRQLFSMGFLLTIDTLMYVLIVPPMLVSLSPRLAGLALLPLLAIPIFVYRAGKVIHNRFRVVQDTFGDMTAAVEENVAGIRVVKSFAQEARQVARLRSLNERSLRENMSLQKAQGLYQPAVSMAMSVSIFLVILIGGRAAIRGGISIGDFVAFQHYLARLMWPMQAVGMTVGLYQRGLASARRIDEVLHVRPEIADGPETDAAARVERGEIEIRDLTFSYATDGGRHALAGVSIKVPAGAVVALVGPVGSGKSTLLNLVPRLFDPPPGTVLVDGRDVRTYPLARLRGAIGYVPQETFLFADTIAENVALGAPDASREAILEAAEAACIRAEIERVPGGFEAPLGERGVNLSGGQRQRIALARALVRKPKVLLLDDCLSAVDAETEHAILERLRGEMRGRTCLIASHRLAAVKDANEIIVLDEGRVKERGTHEALLARGGLYADLWARQRLEAELEVA